MRPALHCLRIERCPSLSRRATPEQDRHLLLDQEVLVDRHPLLDQEVLLDRGLLLDQRVLPNPACLGGPGDPVDPASAGRIPLRQGEL